MHEGLKFFFSITPNAPLNSSSNSMKFLPLSKRIVCTFPLLAICSNKYRWISVKGMIYLSMYCLAIHACEHCSIVLDLTPPLFYYERVKYAYSTECEWWSFSNSTIWEVYHLLFNQFFTQPVALYIMENYLLDCCIPTYNPITRASKFIQHQPGLVPWGKFWILHALDHQK